MKIRDSVTICLTSPCTARNTWPIIEDTTTNIHFAILSHQSISSSQLIVPVESSVIVIICPVFWDVTTK